MVQRQTAGGLAGLLGSPGYLFGRATTRAIAPAGDPSLREATPATVMALTVDDAQRFFKAAYRPDLTTIVLVGNVSPEHARTAVEHAFGSWTAEGPTPAVDLPAVPNSVVSKSYVPDRSALQSNIQLGETVPVKVDDPKHFVLTLGNEILGDGFSSRLYRDLRVKSGYVYSVSSALHWSRDRADYTISYGADAKNVGPARDLAVADIHAMQDAPVSDGELTRAKASLLRQIPMGRASFDATVIEGEHVRHDAATGQKRRPGTRRRRLAFRPARPCAGIGTPTGPGRDLGAVRPRLP